MVFLMDGCMLAMINSQRLASFFLKDDSISVKSRRISSISLLILDTDLVSVLTSSSSASFSALNANRSSYIYFKHLFMFDNPDVVPSRDGKGGDEGSFLKLFFSPAGVGAMTSLVTLAWCGSDLSVVA
jgi:hypothetical protein